MYVFRKEFVKLRLATLFFLFLLGGILSNVTESSRLSIADPNSYKLIMGIKLSFFYFSKNIIYKTFK